MKYNYETAIKELGAEIKQEFDKYIVCTYDLFDFKVYKQKLRGGNVKLEGNFRACLNPVEYFKHYMNTNCKHKNLDFSNTVFKGMREHVYISCKEHGEFRTTPELLINRNSGCGQCYNKYEKFKVKNKGKDKFVEEANERFENKFDYSLVEYKNTMTKVKIICPMHGAFHQTPNEHLQSKYGCNECYKTYNSFKMEDYVSICPNGSSLYIVQLKNAEESFYKVGISKDIDKRFSRFKRYGYEIGDNIIFFNEDAGLVFCIEDDLLLNNKCNKYIPKTKFEGWTECFTYIDVDEVSQMFYTFSQLKKEMQEIDL